MDFGEKSIMVTFGNGTSSKYLVATINVKIGDEEYLLEAVVIPNPMEEVLLRRDIPLCKHQVRRLPWEEQIRGGFDGPAGPAMAGPLSCFSPFLNGRCGN